MVLLIISIVVVGVCVCEGGWGGRWPHVVRDWGGILSEVPGSDPKGDKKMYIYKCLSKKNIDVPYLVFSVYQLQLKSISNHTSSL